VTRVFTFLLGYVIALILVFLILGPASRRLERARIERAAEDPCAVLH
jgi:hypothetical protein